MEMLLPHEFVTMSTEAVVPIAGSTVSVIVTKRAAEVEAYVREVRSSVSSAKMVVGLDVEWNFPLPGKKVALLQLCSGAKCLIVQLGRFLDHVPQSLKDLLADPGVTFVGVGITADVAKLGRDYGLSCKRAVELGHVAAKSMVGYEEAGLVDLARWVLGLNIEKPASVALSYWGSVNLRPEQIMYATTDAYVSYLIGVKLLGAN